MVPVVGLGRFLRLFRAILTHFRRLLKLTLNLLEPTRNLQSADDFADTLSRCTVNGLSDPDKKTVDSVSVFSDQMRVFQ